MSSNRSLLSYLRGVALTAPFVAYLSLADAVLSLLLPLKPLAPGVVYEASSSIAWFVWALIQLIFMRFDGARIFVSGDDLPAGESAVVIANHLAWPDFYLIHDPDPRP